MSRNERENKVFSPWVKKFCEEKGAIVLNIHGHLYQVAGIADLYICHWKWIGWVELKCGSNKLSAIQKKFLKDVYARGSPYAVLRLCQDPYRNVDYVILEDYDDNKIAEVAKKDCNVLDLLAEYAPCK